MDTVLTRLEFLRKKGYSKEFSVKDAQLFLPDGKRINPKSAQIDASFRIEGDSDPTHQAAVYGISCPDSDLKGTLVTSYGPYSDPEVDKVIEQIPVSESALK